LGEKVKPRLAVIERHRVRPCIHLVCFGWIMFDLVGLRRICGFEDGFVWQKRFFIQDVSDTSIVNGDGTVSGALRRFDVV
jgi:hypothetical protein